MKKLIQNTSATTRRTIYKTTKNYFLVERTWNFKNKKFVINRKLKTPYFLEAYSFIHFKINNVEAA